MDIPSAIKICRDLVGFMRLHADMRINTQAADAIESVLAERAQLRGAIHGALLRTAEIDVLRVLNDVLDAHPDQNLQQGERQ